MRLLASFIGLVMVACRLVAPAAADGAPDSAAAGELGGTEQPAGAAEFYLECSFRLRAPETAGFLLQISDATAQPVVRLGFQANQGWQVQTVSSHRAFSQSLSDLAPVHPAAWYHLRFTGRSWGETNARYNLRLIAPDGSVTRATNLVFFLQPPGAVPRARHYAFCPAATGADLESINAGLLTPYSGPVVTAVNTSTLAGKVMCGYQGWFGTPGDGRSEPDWRHWTKHFGPLQDGNAKVDLWPDISQFDVSQRFATGFKMPDGSTATVFSSFQKSTVLTHFAWMRDYRIDGVFVQRFANGLNNPPSRELCDTVLANCREGANRFGRTYAVMYDLSGLAAGHVDDVINDWRRLRRTMVITEDPAYLHHRGKPVVAVWGIGFNDHRAYTLAECRRLVAFLKNDPEAGGCTVMLGVPTNWRELKGDAINDPALLDVIGMADIVSPWTVGRYSDPEGARRYAGTVLKPDLAWCRQRGLDYLPVVFPGFSWHNMKGGPLDQIPRRRGKFLWSQFEADTQAHASMLYVAMFDEVDEGTAIFKCANTVPVGVDSKFVTFEGLPSDFYLKMVGAGARLLRGSASEAGLSFSGR